jgi:hypothetical protein
MLTFGHEYVDRGIEFYETKYRQQCARNKLYRPLRIMRMVWLSTGAMLTFFRLPTFFQESAERSD